MIGYFLLFQIFTTVAGKPYLNPGFNLNAFYQDQLNLHNYYRAKHGVPMMTLDSTLTQQAQSYAEELARIGGGLKHCNLPSCDREGAGENLASAWGSSTTAETNATKAWYDEIWDYNFCSVNGGTRPGHEGKKVGHFSQVVWKTSVKLGIGYARTMDRKKVYVVARYLKHGNFRRRYLANVPKPSYIFQTFQNNCKGINGGLARWSAPGQCSRSCGGGVQFRTRTCTNPKPSLNGHDCDGTTKEIAIKQWCNTQNCLGTKIHRDEQCEARGRPAKSHNFEGQKDCQLHCFRSGRTYVNTGTVDDGTHCSWDSGVCVAGVCVDMPDYSPPTVAPASGPITGKYTGTPSSKIWDNKILTIPNGATSVTITNKKYHDVEIAVGYRSSRRSGYRFSERTWMDRNVQRSGKYETTRTIFGVTFKYTRDAKMSTIKIAGPVRPTRGYSVVLFVRGKKPADIFWSYTF